MLSIKRKGTELSNDTSKKQKYQQENDDIVSLTGLPNVIIDIIFSYNKITISTGDELKIESNNELWIHMKYITFGFRFNQPILPGVLPQNLKELSFGFRFNQPIGEGILPQSLIHLNLGSFNQPILPGILPQSLIHLNLGEFNHPILPGVLHQSLKEL